MSLCIGRVERYRLTGQRLCRALRFGQIACVKKASSLVLCRRKAVVTAGEIRIESTPGAGTTAFLFLPAR